MLRITVHNNPRTVTFQLEGSLSGPWLPELEKCWQSTLAGHPKAIRRVDLTGVTYIDAAGKACLETMHRQGAEFLAADCLTKDIVAEVTQASVPEPGVLNHEAYDPVCNPASERESLE
jgi:ABC-type transporter Mla MlaB component